MKDSTTTTTNNKAQIEFDYDEHKYDESNPLMISKDVQTNKSQNVKKSKKNKHIDTSKLLSKKKKKKLEKILERKNRKINRVNLINDLQKYQVSDKEYNFMPSTSVIQTTGKRKINELLKHYQSINNNEKEKNDDKHDNRPMHKKLKIRRIKLKNNEKNFNRKDPNIIDFNTIQDSSSEPESETENESEIEDKIESPEVKDEGSIEEKKLIIESNPIKKVSENEKISPEKQNLKPKIQSIYVTVDRHDDVQKARLKLPILVEEHNIMEAIMEHPVVIICGETGSGKTTQIPQFLYEAGYTINNKIIGITEPRRVAAVSMSKRVAYELNLTQEEVSYQIRFEGNVTDKTKIKFMTDGILMKEIGKDFLLRKYSVLIIDEAHERGLYSDILIGFLSRIIKLRNKRGDPLKLIIMSATLRVKDFTENQRLFEQPPPVIKIDSRQYPVSVHFSKHTNPNYIQEAFKKICKIHTVAPPGGILVFVTGRKEVLSLCAMLKKKFPWYKNNELEKGAEIAENKIKETKEPTEAETENVAEEEKKLQQNIIKSNKVNLDLYSVEPSEMIETMENEFGDLDHSDDESNHDDNSSDEEDEFEDIGFMTTTQPLYCLPLYSMMPSKKQSLVFNDPPAGCRLCVIATNIAETSLTIPNIKYVIDTGKVKNKHYDNVTSISTFLIEWTSKASADQRAGRAGRTSAGHCYRLYSSAIFNDEFKEFTDPEIIQKPIDDLLLQMKSIGIDNVINFPFPTQPNVDSLMAAEKRLIFLDALEEKTFIGKGDKEIFRSKITPIGKLMSYFPVNPRFSKMLCLSNQCNLMPYTIIIISAMTVQELFLTNVPELIRKRREDFFSMETAEYHFILGDLWLMISAFILARQTGFSSTFCQHYGLRYNAIIEMNKLRQLLSRQIKKIIKSNASILDEPIKLPDRNQCRMLAQLFLCVFGDHLAMKVPFILVQEQKTQNDTSIQIIERKIQKHVENCYQSIDCEDYVFLANDSSVSKNKPNYVAYHEIFESSNKMIMRNVVPIESEWIPIYVPKLCKFSNPLDSPPPRYDSKQDKLKCFREATFGPYNWKLPTVEMEYPETFEKYRYFAYFLFNGDVLKFFKKNSKFLSSPAVIFQKSWGLVQPKVEMVIKRLMMNKICTRHDLIEHWKQDKKFLLKEYLEWIHDAERQRIRDCWPPQS